jgi:hypothetical protein
MTSPERSAPRRRLLAARRYARLLRLYPRAHRQVFGEQMRQTFRDHYHDAVEQRGVPESWFWLEVVRDAGPSVVREHLAALVEGICSMRTVLAAPLWVWRRRQTRRLALLTQLCLLAAVLLVWTPLLVGQVLLATAQHGLLHAHAGMVSYSIGAAVERPTTQFVSAFTQATTDIAAHELRAYHFRSSHVEFSTLPLALAAVGVSASGTSAATPACLLDGEPAARLATDLRVVAGRLPMPATGVLEVVVTPATADRLHLALGTSLPITAIAGQQAPIVRVVGIVQTLGSVFPTNRATFDPANQDMVLGYAQSHPLDYVLTSTEAIGTYAYDWAQIETVEPFYSQASGPNPVPPSENPALWQAWWIGTTDYARMDAQALTAFVSHRAPDPSPRLNQLLTLLGAPALARQAGFAPGGTWAGFYEGNADDEDATVQSTLAVWVLAGLVAMLLVRLLWPLACQLVERQQPLLAELRDRGDRDRERDREISRGRVAIGGALALQALAPATLALLAGGLLALLLARLVTVALLPAPVRPVVDTLVSGPLDTGYGFGQAGGIAAVVLTMAAVLVMLLAMRYAMGHGTPPALASDYDMVSH